MHQIFLGTAKVLSEMILSLVKGSPALEPEKTILNCEVPFVSQIEKCLGIIFRKAFDFKLFFFHLGPLALKNVHLPNEHYESFCKLSFSVRVLRATDIHSSDLRHADNLIELFSNFC